MDTRIEAALSRGGGLVTTADLARHGIEARTVARLARTGALVAVRRGVYTSRQLWDSWGIYRDRPLARVRAADRCIAIDHVSSHDSAALVHDLPLIRPQDSAVHITRLDRRGTRVEHGVEHHGARYDPDQVVRAGSLHVLDIPRTVADLAREHGYRAGLVAADGAMQKGVSRACLRDAARRMSGWPFSLVVAQVVNDADPGAESLAESLGRELVWESGLTRVETQFPVTTRRGAAWVDMRIGRQLVEVHGRKKFISVADGGLRDRDLEEQMWNERQRMGDVCDGGFVLTPLYWADFWGERRNEARDRLVRDQALATSRFGTELTAEMLEFAERMRGRRYRVAG